MNAFNPPPLKNPRGRPLIIRPEVQAVIDGTAPPFPGHHIVGPLSTREQGRWRKNLAYAANKIGAKFTIRITEDNGLWVTRVETFNG